MARFLSPIEAMRSDVTETVACDRRGSGCVPLFVPDLSENKDCRKTVLWRGRSPTSQRLLQRGMSANGSPKESAGLFQKRQDRKLVAERNGVGFGITVEEYRGDEREKRLECEAVL